MYIDIDRSVYTFQKLIFLFLFYRQRSKSSLLSSSSYLIKQNKNTGFFLPVLNQIISNFILKMGSNMCIIKENILQGIAYICFLLY